MRFAEARLRTHFKTLKTERTFEGSAVEVTQFSFERESQIFSDKTLSYDGVFFVQRAVAVLSVAEHGTADKCRMRAYLVGFACVKRNLYKRDIPPIFGDAVFGYYLFGGSRRRGIYFNLALFRVLNEVCGKRSALTYKIVFA